MTYTLRNLISMLKAHPTSEKETGWNSAIITLLKVSSESKTSKKAMHPLSQHGIKREEAEMIESSIRAGNKLSAVKLIKDLTGLGLKESKDIVDYYSANHINYEQ